MQPPRINADWLRTPATRAVFAALSAVGADARAVGGAVRNALMGQAITDIDIATTAPPETTRSAALAAGLDAIDTGMAHGTVTVVSNGFTYEVTTLRRDVATDGRRAEVAFTDDWAADASRRDFTINALYCDADGQVHDPIGGYADILDRRVRFIGDAAARIREDYLRILRFFRFSATYAQGALDPAGLTACSRNRQGLDRLSAERIRTELIKLLAAPRAVEIAEVMHGHGYWPALLGLAIAPRHLTDVSALSDDPLVRLAALCIGVPEDARRLAARLRLSNTERETLVATADLARRPWPDMPAPDLRRLLYAQGRPRALIGWTVSRARHQGRDDRWQAAAQLIRTWPIPSLPVAGRDLLAAGIDTGPEIGRRLARAEAAWIASDFTLEREAMIRIAVGEPG